MAMDNIYDEPPLCRLETLIQALDGITAALLAGAEAGNKECSHHFAPHDLEGLYVLVSIIKLGLCEVFAELNASR
ncbi:MAG: hypothetical protein FWC38_00505 [Proteobacteria bacterium]|nr:hypothetical protein [Pseudomonadota bacterium]MCL2306723.1 hypothetical protein [Pseudomonadota bacterium]